MKIGIFDPYLDTLGGGEKFMLTAASCLSKNHEVFVFWDEPLLEKSSLKFNLDLSKVQQTKNIFSKGIKLPTRLIQSQKYDLIFYLSDGSIPLVATKLYVHFQFPVEWVNTKGFVKKAKIKRVRKFICNSRFTKEFIDKKFDIKSAVLYPPTYFEKDFPKVSLESKKNYILNVGRLSKLSDGTIFKKQDFLISAFKKLIDKGVKGWELVIVVSVMDRDKALLEELRQLAKNYPVKIYANISSDRLQQIYKESKIYWHASGFGENLELHPEKAEHFGITTVEAMANGLVAVVINEGGQKEIVNDGEDGFLFNTEKELLDKTIKLIRDEKLFETISANATGKSKLFTSDRFCNDLGNLIL